MPKAKSAKAAGSEAIKGLKAIFDRLSKRAGGTGNAKSKAAAERTKDTEEYVLLDFSVAGRLSTCSFG
jgi:hypothetical protein